jgi:hypothetical protein
MLNESKGAKRGPLCLHRIAIPRSLSCVVAVIPQIELLELVAPLVFEDATHRQCSARGRANQIDVVDGVGRCLQPPALRRVQVVEAPHLQPTAIVVADIETIRLRQFAQCGLEEPDSAIDFAPIIRVGKKGTGRQHANEGAQSRQLSFQAAERVRAGGIHRGRRRLPRSCMKGQDLDEYQTCGESRDEDHHG